MEPADATARELSERIARGDVTCEAVAESVVRRADRIEPRLHAYRRFDREGLLARARELDRSERGGKRGPLFGIPLALKDNLCTRGVPTTCCSKILENFTPPYDATVVRKLAAAGSMTTGKTNMDEFAMGSSTENSAFGVTKNPWDLSRIPGGSSGGSAAAVAAGECVAALGSDTGGSIRQPAALCGVVGLKPTYGRVSRYGLIAFASSLDQIGPITRDVGDCALLMNVLAGHDPLDSTSADVAVPDYTRNLEDGAAGLVLGMPREYFAEGLDGEVAAAIAEARRVLEGAGAKVVDISLPRTPYAVATYYIVATAEASSNLARYDGVKYGFRCIGARDLLEMYARTRAEGFGQEVKRRIMLGTYALSSGYYDAYYKKAQQVRTLIREDFAAAFRTVDAILTPTSPTAAFRIGEKTDDPLQMYLSDIYTISVNLAGIPGISIPCGFTRNGLPVGLQILGKPFDEATILKVARAFERATDHHRRRPDL